MLSMHSKLFHKYVTTQFNIMIKVVQSDFGGELRSFTSYLKELGVRPQF